MRKIISTFLLVIIVFNFIICNNAYATNPEGDESISGPLKTYTEQGNFISDDIAGKYLEGEAVSKSPDGSQKSKFNLGDIGTSAIAMVVGLLARLINITIASQIDLFLGLLTHGTEDGEHCFWFSVDRTVFNRIALFNIDYFDSSKDNTYTVGETVIEKNQGNTAIKESVSRVYYVCRIIALVLALLVLIYIGIKMAISTIASDKARYKKMLISWVESIILLSVMLYIMIIIIFVSDKLINIFYNIRNQLLAGGEGIFEETIRSQAWAALFEKSGFDLAIWSIIYWCLLILEVKFFTMYARRLLMIGLLIVISPLIIITYSLDKAGDGKAQGFENWVKEFLISVLIQPLHALIYLVFVFTANAIASRSPLVALALLLSMTTVEKMVRTVFKISGLGALKEMRFLKRGDK